MKPTDQITRRRALALAALLAGLGGIIIATRPPVPVPAPPPAPPPLAAQAPDEPASFVLEGTVAKLVDGDTLDVFCSALSATIRVRLAGVDAPERGQAGGHEATEHLRKFSPVGESVEVFIKGEESWGRAVANVRAGRRWLAREMIRAGHAWQDRRFSKDPELAELQATARANRRGLWSADNPTPPWEYRRELRSRGKDPVEEDK